MLIDESWKKEDGLYGCPSCEKRFSKAGMASHISWCYNTKRDKNVYRESQLKYAEKTKGPIEDHQKKCCVCGKTFVWRGRIGSKAFLLAKYCGHSCSSSIGSRFRKIKFRYRTICKRKHEMKCLVCGYDRAVDTHHLDENHLNDDPDNLIFLCRNHHAEIHHVKYKEEVQKEVVKKLSIGRIK